MTTTKAMLTEAQKQCLRAIRDAGSGVVQRQGRVLAGGEFVKSMPETFLRLIGDGLLEFSEPRRLVLTEEGKDVAACL